MSKSTGFFKKYGTLMAGLIALLSFIGLAFSGEIFYSNQNWLGGMWEVGRLSMVDMIFGGEIAVASKTPVVISDIGITQFSFLTLLPYILVIAGTVTAIVFAILKKNSVFIDLSVTLLFAAATVFFIISPNFAKIQYSSTFSVIINKTKLGVGANIAAAATAISTLLIIIKRYFAK